ncbi:DUF484 family protein [Ramlibacter tataouinensis]|uniref:DUF484 family protein n=1 Tax=Ramlibacter tataouinensis (strain ATCC BAA-407 / DSM 14655 / LMG 21543 / TTB310) TaxID=365046 RepID=F5XZK7_RAMTT|nr:DUF484 family protein [Ramlibacter tataouinensis]AEG92036.1 Conserved hypothetical protein [Ramlibacter tataouinensis TTB310]
MSSPMNPITEDDIANYLANNPAFFQRHAQLLASVQLTSPHGNRAVSLQERQAEMLREKIKALEHRVMDMVRHGNENMVIADRLQRWARQLLLARSSQDLPATIAAEIRSQFMVPQVAIKVWDVDSRYRGDPFAEGVSQDARTFASSLTQPYCGVNSGFEAVGWLDDTAMAMSVALLPLRAGPIAEPAPAFGMLVLASPDPQRFASGMGTDFLERIAELASAALSRLRQE